MNDLSCLNKTAKMLEVSMVQSNGSYDQLKCVEDIACNYGCPCIYVLESFLDEAKREMREREKKIPIGCGVGFPSGGESIEVKLFQLEQLLAHGCDELDVVLNLGKFLSGDHSYVEKELKSIIDAADGKPVKAIIETAILSDDQIKDISKLCVVCGADYIKTGTGWASEPTTIQHICKINEAVDGQIKVKASGGIRSLATIQEMSELGVSRFGVNYLSAMSILDECKRIDEGLH